MTQRAVRQSGWGALRQHEGTGASPFRVQGLGKRGLRWELLNLDESVPEALLRSQDGSLTYRTHPDRLVYDPLPLSAGRTLERAKRRLAEAIQVTRPELTLLEGYVPRIEDNLVPGVHPGDFVSELRCGRGGELTLRRNGGRPKFCAAHSSCALAVNTFAPWKQCPGKLELAGIKGFHTLAFEHPCDIFDWGNPANPDLVARSAHAVVAVEVKCLEFLRAARPGFEAKYDGITDRRTGSAWFGQIALLRSAPTSYRRLQVDQLVKHALGLLYCYPDPSIDLTLMYLYWEPANEAQHPVFAEHRADVTSFARQVAGARPRFVAMTVAELWREWSSRADPPWLRAHVAHLRQRYELSI